MEIQEVKNWGGKKKIMVGLGLALTLFLVALIISTTVDVQNKIKEGKYIGREFEAQNTITVSGEGEIYVKPDLALIDFSVVTEAKTVAKAIEDNTKKMNAVIDEAKKQRVQDQDLKTTSFNISLRYEWQYAETC